MMPFPPGPWLHVPPPEEHIIVDSPHEVSIIDHRGGLSGANHWVGLRLLLLAILTAIAQDGLWTRHTCNLCCQLIYVAGAWRWIRCVVSDGLTAIRFPKCAFYNCQADLLSGEGAR